jgi:ArsR family transcriptional regulator
MATALRQVNDTGAQDNVDAKTQAKYEARARIVKAMAHPTRLFIVDELSRRGERCVCDLTEMVGADISTVSKHLSLLKAAGIVQDDKRGNLGIPCVAQFFDCIESVLRGNAGQCRRALT